MSFVHAFSARGAGGLTGVQADQRDWSPFVVHFTSWSAMQPLRDVFQDRSTASEVSKMLAEADDASWKVFMAIVSSGEIRASQLTGKDGTPLPISSCVCLSECALPGLLGHAERYGRFGFVFRKDALWELGARPCLYVDATHYGLVSKSFRASEPRIYSLYNKHVPPSAARVGGGSPQDYTHEREWRMFDAIALAANPPCCVIVPDEKFVATARDTLEKAGICSDFVLPLNTMFQWGV